MVSSHSMYKHPSKIAKATPIQKVNSALQLKINKNIKLIQTLHNKIKKLKLQLTIDANFKNKLEKKYPAIYREIVELMK